MIIQTMLMIMIMFMAIYHDDGDDKLIRVCGCQLCVKMIMMTMLMITIMWMIMFMAAYDDNNDNVIECVAASCA